MGFSGVEAGGGLGGGVGFATQLRGTTGFSKRSVGVLRGTAHEGDLPGGVEDAWSNA